MTNYTLVIRSPPLHSFRGRPDLSDESDARWDLGGARTDRMSARRVRRAVCPTEKERFGPPETQNRPLPQRHTREQNWAVDRNKCFHGEIGTHSCICFPDNGVDTTSVTKFTTTPQPPKEAPSLPLKRCCHSLAALTSVVVDDTHSVLTLDRFSLPV